MRISVIIPCYNAAVFVEKAVISALEIVEVGEVILVEDGSLDNSLEICQKLSDNHDRVKLLQHPDGLNLGAGASRNLGLKAARFEYIAFLDADDYYLPNRFTTTKLLLQKYPEIDGVYEAAEYVFYSDQARGMHQVNESNLVSMHKDRPPEELFEAFLANSGEWFHLNALTIHKAILIKIGYFDEQLKQAQDTDWLLRLCLKGKLIAGNIQTPVVMIGRHEKNRVLNTEEALYYRFLMFNKWRDKISSMKISRRAKMHFLKSYLDCHPWVRAYSSNKFSRLMVKLFTFIILIFRFPKIIRLLK